MLPAAGETGGIKALLAQHLPKPFINLFSLSARDFANARDDVARPLTRRLNVRLVLTARRAQSSQVVMGINPSHLDAAKKRFSLCHARYSSFGANRAGKIMLRPSKSPTVT